MANTTDDLGEIVLRLTDGQVQVVDQLAVQGVDFAAGVRSMAESHDALLKKVLSFGDIAYRLLPVVYDGSNYTITLAGGSDIATARENLAFIAKLRQNPRAILADLSGYRDSIKQLNEKYGLRSVEELAGICEIHVTRPAFALEESKGKHFFLPGGPIVGTSSRIYSTHYSSDLIIGNAVRPLIGPSQLQGCLDGIHDLIAIDPESLKSGIRAAGFLAINNARQDYEGDKGVCAPWPPDEEERLKRYMDAFRSANMIDDEGYANAMQPPSRHPSDSRLTPEQRSMLGQHWDALFQLHAGAFGNTISRMHDATSPASLWTFDYINALSPNNDVRRVTTDLLAELKSRVGSSQNLGGHTYGSFTYSEGENGPVFDNRFPPNLNAISRRIIEKVDDLPDASSLLSLEDVAKRIIKEHNLPIDPCHLDYSHEIDGSIRSLVDMISFIATLPANYGFLPFDVIEPNKNFDRDKESMDESVLGIIDATIKRRMDDLYSVVFKGSDEGLTLSPKYFQHVNKAIRDTRPIWYAPPPFEIGDEIELTDADAEKIKPGTRGRIVGYVYEVLSDFKKGERVAQFKIDEVNEHYIKRKESGAVRLCDAIRRTAEAEFSEPIKKLFGDMSADSRFVHHRQNEFMVINCEAVEGNPNYHATSMAIRTPFAKYIFNTLTDSKLAVPEEKILLQAAVPRQDFVSFLEILLLHDPHFSMELKCFYPSGTSRNYSYRAAREPIAIQQVS